MTTSMSPSQKFPEAQNLLPHINFQPLNYCRVRCLKIHRHCSMFLVIIAVLLEKDVSFVQACVYNKYVEPVLWTESV